MASLVDLAKKLRPIIEKAAASLNDADAIIAISLFPIWEPAKTYTEGIRVNYNEVLYRCLQTHTSQLGGTPATLYDLWEEVKVEEILEWHQPNGDGYQLGDKISYDGKIWESLINNNIWPPNDLGATSMWKEVDN